MSVQELLENPKSTKFFTTVLAMLIGAAYMFFGPNKDVPGTNEAVAEFMKAIAMAYILGEAGLSSAKAIGSSFGKNGNGQHK